MKMFLAILIFCLPAFGQVAYSGPGSYSGPATYVASNNCAAPNYCAYNGVDVIPAGTAPVLYNSDGTNNGATVYDTSFLGHKNFDGSTFSNSAYLSPVTRLTDTNSAPQGCNTFTAEEGRFSNSSTSLVSVVCNGSYYIGLFSTSGALKGHLSPIHSGTLITEDLCTGAGCTVGSSANAHNFGSIAFSYTDPTAVFALGASGPTTVCPYSINPTTGAYSLDSCIVDFKYGLPQNNAPEWAAATSYHWGDYIKHTLSTSEMATGGAWQVGHTYALGDIVAAQSGSACAYVAQTVSGSNTTGSSPAFIASGPCKGAALIDTTVSGGGNKWRGLSSTAVFVYQNTNTGCSSGCTSGSSFTISGHPDLLSTVADGSNTWTNVGPAYVPVTGNATWASALSVSGDSTYNAGTTCTTGVTCYPSKYAIAISTNSYGCSTGACSSVGYGKWTSDQGSGKDVILYDATANAFQHLDTITGIWMTFTCGSGNGYTCASITASPVGGGPLTTIGNPMGGGACPYVIHDSGMNSLATAPFSTVTEQGGYLNSNPGSNCPALPYQVWNEKPSAFNAATSLQVPFAGLNHSTLDQTELFAFSGQGSGGASNG